MTSGIAGRYATAIFELARDAGEIDALTGDLDALSAALEESSDLRELTTSPIYTRDQQARGLAAVSEKMGLGTLLSNTLGLMASNRRLFVLPRMIAAARGLIAEHRGEVTAEVRSAKPLTDGQTADLAAALKASVGRDVILEKTVDPELLGGLVVKVGSRMIDTSIRAKLNALQNAMKEVG